MATTVAIDKAYFETLLRRAGHHTSGKDIITPVKIPTVCIPKIDHDNLLRMVQEYSSLRDSLCRGGITPETLEILIRGENLPSADADGELHKQESGGSIFARPTKAHVTILHDLPSLDSCSSSRADGQEGLKSNPGLHCNNGSALDDSSFSPDFEKEDTLLAPAKLDRPFYARVEQRTIWLKGLSEKTSHKDIVKIVRGGNVLDVYLRASERSASVSFVEGSAASDFLNYAKRNDVYINGKRVDVSWNDRQFILPGHVANKIGVGATRNLVIRGVHPNITEERLREDLDHIHNLVVIGITFKNNDAYIELNSIHNSLFARTCMMSRATYKGMKIEWYSDECAQPTPKAQYSRGKVIQKPAPVKPPTATLNRFQMLGIDGTEHGSSSEEETTISSDFSSPKAHHGSPWNPRSMAV